MILRWSPRARERAKIVNAWWRANATVPNLFVDELVATLELLVTSPMMGEPYPSRRERGVRRVLMEKTQQHLYYSLNPAKNVIKIVTVWGAKRGRGPSL